MHLRKILKEGPSTLLYIGVQIPLSILCLEGASVVVVCKLRWKLHLWQIHDFPEEVSTPEEGRHTNLAKKGAKLHELEKKFDREKAPASSALPSPLDPPLWLVWLRFQADVWPDAGIKELLLSLHGYLVIHVHVSAFTRIPNGKRIPKGRTTRGKLGKKGAELFALNKKDCCLKWNLPKKNSTHSGTRIQLADFWR